MLDDVEVNFFFTLFLRFLFSFYFTSFLFFLSCACYPFYLFIIFFFQIEDDPIPIESAPAVADISISEGVPVDPIPSVEASIFAKR